MGFLGGVKEVAQAISRQAAGESGGLSKIASAFSKESVETISESAMRNDLKATRMNLYNSLKKNGVLTEEFENNLKTAKEAAKEAGQEFDMDSFLQDNIRPGTGWDATQIKDVDVRDKFLESLGNDLDAYSNKVNNYLARDAEAYFGRESGTGIGYGRVLSGFYGDAEYGATRVGTTAAAVGGTGLGVRYLSGGNLTTNSRGERDIAGIPFI